MIRCLSLTALLLAAPAWAEEPDTGGTLNPEELSIGSVLDQARRGEVGMMVCATGYLVTKSGRHAEAREVFRPCAEAGYTGAMTWMSQLEDNGLGGHADPDAVAAWDRRAADAGDPVGAFNTGLNLMRGRGVAHDEAAGRAWVDRAAAQGLEVAQRLQMAGYDLDEVTPDADNWKYAPLN